MADPKLYLQAHRIYYIPWESHSNFAFTAEMWYLFGLMERGPEAGVPLAKLFHFTCGVGACLAVYAFGARHLSPRVGLLAAGILASTPLVLWEAGTAYADLAGTFFATLTLLAVANGMAARDERWLRLGAVLMGLTLSTKATALSTLALLALALLFWRVRFQGQTWPRALGRVAALVSSRPRRRSPWYIKSTVYTGNPIYPFYYQIFGGRGFNAALAQAYDQSNANFGITYEKQGADPKLVRSPDMAALAPWNLTMYLLPGHPPPNPAFRPFNDVTSVRPCRAVAVAAGRAVLPRLPPGCAGSDPSAGTVRALLCRPVARHLAAGPLPAAHPAGPLPPGSLGSGAGVGRTVAVWVRAGGFGGLLAGVHVLPGGVGLFRRGSAGRLRGAVARPLSGA